MQVSTPVFQGIFLPQVLQTPLPGLSGCNTAQGAIRQEKPPGGVFAGIGDFRVTCYLDLAQDPGDQS